MDNSFTYCSYADTGSFSRLATDYLQQAADIQPFYTYTPDADGLAKAITDRSQYPLDRKLLHTTLHRQYEGLALHANAAHNIELLLSEDTFTVCTAHQPNLLTGYLYFIYKILHAVKLAEELKILHPSKNFVPIYYMGSEDNDLDELGVFQFRGDKYRWDGNGQTGAVGRMATASLKPLLAQLFPRFGPPGSDCTWLQDTITAAYLKHKNIAKATQYLVNELFGRYGLIVIDPDDADLKATFIPVMKDELLHQSALPVIASQIEALGEQYKIQAHPRAINIFYLAEQLRERIEYTDGKWTVVNTDIEWDKDSLLSELEEHPERFSPNVVLRGLFQETILPNVAFIGGGAEVAYWLQLKTLFAHYNVFYPAIVLRQSVLWIPQAAARLRKLLNLDINDVFKSIKSLEEDFVTRHSTDDWQTTEEAKDLTAIFNTIESKANALDPTLKAAAAAAQTRMLQELVNLQKKMLRAEKRKMKVDIDRIARLKALIFPNGSLQERVENFMEYYLDYGPEFLDTVLAGIDPLSGRFLIIEHS